MYKRNYLIKIKSNKIKKKLVPIEFQIERFYGQLYTSIAKPVDGLDKEPIAKLTRHYTQQTDTHNFVRWLLFRNSTYTFDSILLDFSFDRKSIGASEIVSYEFADRLRVHFADEVRNGFSHVWNSLYMSHSMCYIKIATNLYKVSINKLRMPAP